MKILDFFLGSLFICITSLPLILLLLTLQRAPAIPQNPPLDQDQIREVQQLLIDHDPRLLLASEYQEVRLSENELNALLTYIKNNNDVLRRIHIHTDLGRASVRLDLSVPLRGLGLVRYLNLALHFNHEGDTLTLDQVDAGALTLPPAIMLPMRQAIGRRLGDDENFQLLSAFMASLHFESVDEQRMVISLDWQEDNLLQMEDQARQVFVSTKEAERLKFYHDRLTDTLAGFPPGITTVRFNDLLRPLFLHASLNSIGSTSPEAENRAALIVLSAYLTGQDLAQLIGDDVELASPRKLKVVIESREDLARHVASSAAIAASAGAAMAEVLSVYKEVHDSRYRTGFSFTDIAANQAGALLGTLATRNEQDARLFQDLMKNSLSESDFLPSLGTYDGMTEQEFTDRYGSRESPAYLQRLTEITDNIVALPFYQAFAN